MLHWVAWAGDRDAEGILFAKPMEGDIEGDLVENEESQQAIESARSGRQATPRAAAKQELLWPELSWGHSQEYPLQELSQLLDRCEQLMLEPSVPLGYALCEPQYAKYASATALVACGALVAEYLEHRRLDARASGG